MRIDLHTHTDHSDGTDSPTALVEAAVAARLDVLAITDHDTATGWDEAVRAVRSRGIGLVRGMEISCKHNGRSVHLLAYLPDPAYPPLLETLAAIVDGRDERVPRMVERLRAEGIDITEEDVRAQASSRPVEPGKPQIVGRPHVADALVAKGVVKHRDVAFEQYVGYSGPAYVSRPAAALPETIEVVRAAGGVTVVAHAWGRHGRDALSADDLALLRERGLTGLEVDHVDHDESMREELRGIARDLELVVTGSSDYHGTGKRIPIGANLTAPEEYERLVAAAESAARASGRDAPTVV